MVWKCPTNPLENLQHSLYYVVYRVIMSLPNSIQCPSMSKGEFFQKEKNTYFVSLKFFWRETAPHKT